MNTEPVTKSASRHSLINKKNVRRLVLDTANNNRAHSWDRVSDSVFDEAEACLRTFAARKAQSQPSMGRTIK